MERSEVAAFDRVRAAVRRDRRLRIELDPIACEAHGLCAELLPELIELDEWGYPLLAEPDVPDELVPLARRAAHACPTLALRLRAKAAPAHRDRPGAD